MIAYRFWSKSVPVFYVESVKPRGRGDWGYTTDRNKAAQLSTYWRKRFSKD